MWLLRIIGPDALISFMIGPDSEIIDFDLVLILISTLKGAYYAKPSRQLFLTQG